MMAKYRVMFVDDDENFLSMLSERFKDKFDVAAAKSAEEALGLLDGAERDLVVSDGDMPGGMNGTDFLKEVHKRFPKAKTALLTSADIDGYVGFARESPVCSVIPKAIPFSFAEVEKIMTTLLTGEVFGLKSYLNSKDGAVIGTYCVKSSGEAHLIRDKIAAEIGERFFGPEDAKLVLDEILTNAVYHSPLREDGSEKYAMFSEAVLEPSEYIYVEFGCDSEMYGVSVLDNRGVLTRDTVLGKMERQIKGIGHADDSGRGLHMCRLFADRLIVNIERGKRTEVIMLNFLNGKYTGYKPLYINEV